MGQIFIAIDNLFETCKTMKYNKLQHTLEYNSDMVVEDPNYYNDRANHSIIMLKVLRSYMKDFRAIADDPPPSVKKDM